MSDPLRNRQHVQKVVADLFEQATARLCNGILLEQAGTAGNTNADVQAEDGTEWESKAAYRQCWMLEREQLFRMNDIRDSQYILWRYHLSERYTCRKRNNEAGGLLNYCKTVEELQRYLISSVETAHIVPTRLLYEVTRQNARCWSNAGRDGYRIRTAELAAIIGAQKPKSRLRTLQLPMGKLKFTLTDLRSLSIKTTDDIPF